MNYHNSIEGHHEMFLNQLSSLIKIFKSIIICFSNLAKQTLNYSTNESNIQKIYDLLNEIHTISNNVTIIQTKNLQQSKNLQKRLAIRLMEIINVYQTKNQGNLSTLILKKLFSQFKEIIQKLHNENVKFSSFVNEFGQISKQYLENIEVRTEEAVNGFQSMKLLKKMESQKKVLQPFSHKKLFKYRLTKQVKSSIDLYGQLMNVDSQHLKNLFFQSRGRQPELESASIDENGVALKQRQDYKKGYEEWMERKNKIKQKKKKEKTKIFSSPKMNNENKDAIPKKTQPQRQVLRQYNNKSKMLKGQLEKTFINLKQIKNNKPKKSNLEMKQVLVAGDQLDYYSTQKNFNHLNFITSIKASYFLSRNVKVERERKKKSTFGRLFTE